MPPLFFCIIGPQKGGDVASGVGFVPFEGEVSDEGAGAFGGESAWLFIPCGLKMAEEGEVEHGGLTNYAGD